MQWNGMEGIDRLSRVQRHGLVDNWYVERRRQYRWSLGHLHLSSISKALQFTIHRVMEHLLGIFVFDVNVLLHLCCQ